MNRYHCYLVGAKHNVTEMKEIAADFDVKAVLLARDVAVRAGCSRFEVRQVERLVRREELTASA
jgi:hypothetical protein